MKTRIIAIIFFTASSIGMKAQLTDADSISMVYELGEVKITTEKEPPMLPSGTMDTYHTNDAATVSSRLPGVNLVNFGGRGESSVLVRGFDIRSVPVYFDGIPVYVPYDGYMDLGAVNTRNFSGISVSKGYTPAGFGSAAPGGAINIVSRKPVKPLEVRASAGYATGNRQHTSLGIGSKFERFYLSGVFSTVNQDHFPLSADFDTTGLTVTEDGQERDNSWFSHMNLNLKAGFTPNEFDEYSLNFLMHRSEKGTPPYAGTDPQQRERFWRWPYWNKNSLYFIGKKRTGDFAYFKFRAYYDDFSNQLSSFDDNTYSSQTRGYAFNSYYDDYSIGSGVEYNYTGIEGNHLRFIGRVKDDHHAEHNEEEPTRNFRDVTFTAGVEDVMRVSKNTRILGNFIYSARSGLLAEEYVPADSSIDVLAGNSARGISAQLALQYSIAEDHDIQFGIYRKFRFATMKERYSYRAGFGIPNPDLGPERGTQAELKYRGKVTDMLKLDGAVFYTLMDDAIVVVYDTITGLNQSQNTGTAQNYGMEFSAEFSPARFVSLAANYAYVSFISLYDPDTYFTHVPEHEVNVSVQVEPTESFDISGHFRYMSERYSTSYGTIAGAFSTIDLQASYTFRKLITLEAGIENLLDRDYALTEGFPAPGRTWFASLNFQL